jgi:hypothetical protein
VVVRDRPADPPLSQATRMYEMAIRDHPVRECRLAAPALEILRDRV